MATRIALRARLSVLPARSALVALAALGATMLLLPTSAAAAPAPSQPTTVASVTALLHQLSEQNEQLNEQIDVATIAVQSQTAAVARAEDDAALAQLNYENTRAMLTASLTAQYEGGSAFSRAGALLSSESGQNYVDKLTTLNMLTMHQTDILRQVDIAQAAATAAQKHAADLLATANTTRDKLNAQQAILNADAQKYQTLLAKLSAPQRATYIHQNDPTPTQVAAAITVHAGTAGAQKAIDYAMAQVHKRYVFKGVGPNAFDCSGLTMMAYAQAGVGLPHSAAEQYHYGTHVDVSQLQPGDLIFLYHPIGHVEIYIGGGLAVSAADPAEGVVIVNINNDMAHYVGATRLT